jgi:hypothetical protein
MRAALLALVLLGCHPLPKLGPTLRIVRADTVFVGTQRCVFLTLSDSTHALEPNNPPACDAAFARWVAERP